VVGTTPRRTPPGAAAAASGELCALVTVDLYNEGVDLPMVDTLLLLRPTQSPVLFQQQIGRGLRLAPGKESCLVLDFVGQHRADFRFDRLLSSLTGLSRRELVDGVEKGFGSLPPGCHIHLQRQTREQVLQGLRALVQQNWRRLKTELQAYAALRGRTSCAWPTSCATRRSSWKTSTACCTWMTPRARPAAEGCRTGARASTATVVTSDRLLQMLAYQVDGQHHEQNGAAASISSSACHRSTAPKLGRTRRGAAGEQHVAAQTRAGPGRHCRCACTPPTASARS
jgi:hypothetical protein